MLKSSFKSSESSGRQASKSDLMKKLAEPMSSRRFEGGDPLIFISQYPEIIVNAKAKGVYDFISGKTTFKTVEVVNPTEYVRRRTAEYRTNTDNSIAATEYQWRREDEDVRVRDRLAIKHAIHNAANEGKLSPLQAETLIARADVLCEDLLEFRGTPNRRVRGQRDGTTAVLSVTATTPLESTATIPYHEILQQTRERVQALNRIRVLDNTAYAFHLDQYVRSYTAAHDTSEAEREAADHTYHRVAVDFPEMVRSFMNQWASCDNPIYSTETFPNSEAFISERTIGLKALKSTGFDVYELYRLHEMGDLDDIIVHRAEVYNKAAAERAKAETNLSKNIGIWTGATETLRKTAETTKDWNDKMRAKCVEFFIDSFSSDVRVICEPELHVDDYAGAFQHIVDYYGKVDVDSADAVFEMLSALRLPDWMSYEEFMIIFEHLTDVAAMVGSPLSEAQKKCYYKAALENSKMYGRHFKVWGTYTHTFDELKSLVDKANLAIRAEEIGNTLRSTGQPRHRPKDRAHAKVAFESDDEGYDSESVHYSHTRYDDIKTKSRDQQSRQQHDDSPKRGGKSDRFRSPDRGRNYDRDYGSDHSRSSSPQHRAKTKAPPRALAAAVPVPVREATQGPNCPRCMKGTHSIEDCWTSCKVCKQKGACACKTGETPQQQAKNLIQRVEGKVAKPKALRARVQYLHLMTTDISTTATAVTAPAVTTPPAGRTPSPTPRSTSPPASVNNCPSSPTTEDEFQRQITLATAASYDQLVRDMETIGTQPFQSPQPAQSAQQPQPKPTATPRRTSSFEERLKAEGVSFYNRPATGATLYGPYRVQQPAPLSRAPTVRPTAQPSVRSSYPAAQQHSYQPPTAEQYATPTEPVLAAANETDLERECRELEEQFNRRKQDIINSHTTAQPPPQQLSEQQQREQYRKEQSERQLKQQHRDERDRFAREQQQQHEDEERKAAEKQRVKEEKEHATYQLQQRETRNVEEATARSLRDMSPEYRDGMYKFTHPESIRTNASSSTAFAPFAGFDESSHRQDLRGTNGLTTVGINPARPDLNSEDYQPPPPRSTGGSYAAANKILKNYMPSDLFIERTGEDEHVMPPLLRPTPARESEQDYESHADTAINATRAPRTLPPTERIVTRAESKRRSTSPRAGSDQSNQLHMVQAVRATRKEALVPLNVSPLHSAPTVLNTPNECHYLISLFMEANPTWWIDHKSVMGFCRLYGKRDGKITTVQFARILRRFIGDDNTCPELVQFSKREGESFSASLPPELRCSCGVRDVTQSIVCQLMHMYNPELVLTCATELESILMDFKTVFSKQIVKNKHLQFEILHKTCVSLMGNEGITIKTLNHLLHSFIEHYAIRHPLRLRTSDHKLLMMNDVKTSPRRKKGKQPATEIYYDSGASRHMTNEHSCHALTHRKRVNKTVQLGSEESVLTSNISGHHDIFQNTLCVPGLIVPLAAVCVFDREGFTSSFSNRCFTIKYAPQDLIIACGEMMEDGLYKFTETHEDNYRTAHKMMRDAAAAATATAATDTTVNCNVAGDAETDDYNFVKGSAQNTRLVAGKKHMSKLMWLHRRLGHVPERKLKKMVRDKAVRGLGIEYDEIKDETLGVCDDCCKGRSKAFPNRAEDRSALKDLKVCELVGTDPSGKVTPASVRGYRYAFFYVDAVSKKTFVDFGAHKSEQYESLKNFKTNHVDFYGWKLKVLQTDYDTLFRDVKVQKWCSQNGISHRMSTPYVHAQNGLIERAIQSLLDKCRTMLAEFGAPPNLWCYALEHAAYAINHTPQFNPDSKKYEIPEEVHTGQPVDVSNLVPFFAPAIAHIHSEERRGWDVKAFNCRVIGYDKQTKNGYIVQMTGRSRRIVTRKDVIVKHYTEDEGAWDSMPDEYKHGTATEQVVPQPVDADPDDRFWCELDTNPYWDQTALPPEPRRSSRLRAHLAKIENPPDPLLSGRLRAKVQLDIEVERANIAADCRVNDDNDLCCCNQCDNHNITSYAQLLECIPEHALLSPADVPPRKTDFNFAERKLPPVPSTLEEALKGEWAEDWLEAMETELLQLYMRGTFERVPYKAKAMKSKWVFLTKWGPDGNVLYKARLVACGYSQRFGIDFYETFSPTVNWRTVLVILHVAKSRGWTITGIDVSNAYLEADQQVPQSMNLPKGMGVEGKYSVKLLKSIYGQKDAGLLWFQRLAEILLSLGFEQTVSDSCVYTKRRGLSIVVITTYVDDCLIVGNCAHMIKEARDGIASAVLKIKDLGTVTRFLGVDFEHLANNKLKLCQREYINKIAEKLFNDETGHKYKASSIPMTPNVDLTADETETTGAAMYNVMGLIRFAVDRTRPDGLLAASIASSHSIAPTERQLEAGLKIGRWLKTTEDKALYIGGNAPLRLIGMTDASWNVRCQLGYSFFLSTDSGTVSSKSMRDTTISRSSTESEIKALDEGCKECIWLRGLLFELGCEQKGPTTIYVDNLSAKTLSESLQSSNKTKHIRIKIEAIRRNIRDGIVALEHRNTKDLVADILTKPLPDAQFNRLSKILLEGHDSVEQVGKKL